MKPRWTLERYGRRFEPIEVQIVSNSRLSLTTQTTRAK
jgi:hypothetical protein